MVSTTTLVTGESLVVGEINTGDGLGDGHNFVARDVFVCVGGRLKWVKRLVTNESFIEKFGGGRMLGDVEGYRGSDSGRKVCLAVSADGNGYTRW